MNFLKWIRVCSTPRVSQEGVDRQDARPDDPRVAAGAGRSGDRMKLANFRYWHKADMAIAFSDVRFSNRPFGVKHFQTVRRCSVDVTHGLVLLFGIGTKAVPSWDSKTRWSNLLVGLAGRRTAGPSGHANSPRITPRSCRRASRRHNHSLCRCCIRSM